MLYTGDVADRLRYATRYLLCPVCAGSLVTETLYDVRSMRFRVAALCSCGVREAYVTKELLEDTPTTAIVVSLLQNQPVSTSATLAPSAQLVEVQQVEQAVSAEQVEPQAVRTLRGGRHIRLRTGEKE